MDSIFLSIKTRLMGVFAHSGERTSLKPFEKTFLGFDLFMFFSIFFWFSFGNSFLTFECMFFFVFWQIRGFDGNPLRTHYRNSVKGSSKNN